MKSFGRARIGVSLLLVVVACGETGGKRASPRDAGVERDATPDVPPRIVIDSGPRTTVWSTGEPSPFEGELTSLERGEYLVRHVAACAECHAPRLDTGAWDETVFLSGVEGIFDLAPDDAEVGLVSSANLTPDEQTGLGAWSDDEIKTAFLDGVNSEGEPLHPLMPYFVFHNMRAEDADAIVEYLRSLAAVEHAVPVRQPLPEPLLRPATPLPRSLIPEPQLDPEDAEYAAALRGRYLTAEIGICVYCHTAPSAGTEELPLDVDHLLQGHREFPPLKLGSPPLAERIVIESRNLTPHPTGLDPQLWSPEAVARTLKVGMNALGLGMCDPMPSGPRAAFGRLTDQDALDIGTYLMSLRPADSGPIEECCRACHQEGRDPIGIDPVATAESATIVRDWARLASAGEGPFHVPGRSACAPVVSALPR